MEIWFDFNLSVFNSTTLFFSKELNKNLSILTSERLMIQDSFIDQLPGFTCANTVAQHSLGEKTHQNVKNFNFF